MPKSHSAFMLCTYKGKLKGNAVETYIHCQIKYRTPQDIQIAVDRTLKTLEEGGWKEVIVSSIYIHEVTNDD